MIKKYKLGSLIKTNEKFFDCFDVGDIGIVCDSGSFYDKSFFKKNKDVFLILINRKMIYINICYLEMLKQ